MADDKHSNGTNLWYCPGDTTPGGNGLFYPACDLLVKERESFDPTGKIILSNFSFPSADAIFNAQKNKVSRQFLREYISFLEVIVLYEQLLVVNQPYIVTAEDYGNPDSPIYNGFGYFDYDGDANLREKVDALRRSESWIIDTIFDIPDLEVQPTIYAAQTRAARGESQSGHPPHAEDLYYDVFHDGQPFSAYQVARNLSMPFYGPKVEYHPLVLKEEVSTGEIERSVTSRLKKRLNAGAEVILEELSKQGSIINFNASPIGALIIERSKKPSDMMSVALELREKYTPFRRNSQELESVLFDPEISVRKKMRATAEIERISSKLWGSPDGGMDRYIKSSGSLIGYALQFEDEGLSVKKITDSIMSAPVEYVVEKIKNRKYRLLFDARDSFLKQANVEARIAKLFSQDTKKTATVQFEETSCLHWWGVGHSESSGRDPMHNRETEVFDESNFDDDIPF